MQFLNTLATPLSTVDTARDYQGGGSKVAINLSNSYISLGVALHFNTDDELRKSFWVKCDSVGLYKRPTKGNAGLFKAQQSCV